MPASPSPPELQAEHLLQAASTFQTGGLGVGYQEQGWGRGRAGRAQAGPFRDRHAVLGWPRPWVQGDGTG